MATTTLEILGKDSGAQALLKGVNQALVESGQSADSTQVHFHGMKEGSDGLFGSLKELRSEVRGHDRVFKFYGAQLSGLTGVTRSFGTELAGLGIALGSGMWMVAAIEGIKLVAGHFLEAAKAAEELNKKKLEEIKKQVDELSGSAYEAENHLYELMGGNRKGKELEDKIQKVNAALKEVQQRTGVWNESVSKDDRKLEAELREQLRVAIDAKDRWRELSSSGKKIEDKKKDDKEAQQAMERQKAAAQDHAAFIAQMDQQGLEGRKKIDAEENAEIVALMKRSEILTAQQVMDEYAAIQAGTARKIALYEAEEKKKDDLHKQELEKLQAQDMKALQRMVNTSQREIAASVRGFMQPIRGAIDSMVDGLMNGTLKMKDIWKGLWQGMIKTVIGALENLGEEYLANAIAKKLIDGNTALISITGDAAQGGAAAAAAAAPLFWWNPGIAVGIGEAMNASILGAFMPEVALATGTWNVPADMPAMIHQGEGVMPKPLMDAVKSGEATIGGGGSGGHTFIINALDARSFRQYLRDNSRLVAEAVGIAARNGASFQGA